MSNLDTQTSPGIGLLAPAFSVMGGLIIDMVGSNGQRLTQQISASRLFKGWTPTGVNWLTIIADDLAGIDFAGLLGEGSGPPTCASRCTTETPARRIRSTSRNSAPGISHTSAAPRSPETSTSTADAIYSSAFWTSSATRSIAGYMGESTTYRLNSSGVTIGYLHGLRRVCSGRPTTMPSFPAARLDTLTHTTCPLSR